MGIPERALGFRLRPVRNVAVAVPCSVGEGDSRPVRRRGPGQRGRGDILLSRLLVSAQRRGARGSAKANGCCCTSARSITKRRCGSSGLPVGHHVGGYTPFTIDLTPCALGAETLEIVVRAEDDPQDLAKPRGKQDWQLEPHSIWYPRTTGIWQTVWMEIVPDTWIGTVRWTPNLARWEIGLEAWVAGARREPLRLHVRLRCGRRAHCRRHVTRSSAAKCTAASRCPIPALTTTATSCCGVPSRRRSSTPRCELWGERGELLDEVASYTALRAVAVQGDRFVLNGRPYQLRLVLDQGYWPDGGLTAPDDAALRRDVELAKAMGFNGVRKHQKIEDPRYLYWADRLGLLVWEEMPSAYRFTQDSVERVTREWTEAHRSRLQPSVHRRVGAVQRVVGCAEPAGQSGANGTTCRRCIT